MTARALHAVRGPSRFQMGPGAREDRNRQLEVTMAFLLVLLAPAVAASSGAPLPTFVGETNANYAVRNSSLGCGKLFEGLHGGNAQFLLRSPAPLHADTSMLWGRLMSLDAGLMTEILCPASHAAT